MTVCKYCSQKLGEDFAKFLWPSQNIWTLPGTSYLSILTKNFLFVPALWVHKLFRILLTLHCNSNSYIWALKNSRFSNIFTMESHFWSSIMYCSGPDKQLKKSKQIHISATIVLKLTQPFTNKNPKITFTKKSKGGF